MNGKYEVNVDMQQTENPIDMKVEEKQEPLDDISRLAQIMKEKNDGKQ